MKRQTTRLTIAGETIRRLDVTELREVIGGAPQCSLANKDSCWPDPPPRFEEPRGSTVWSCGPTKGPTGTCP